MLNRIGFGWWHSCVSLDGFPTIASLIPSQNGSPSTAPAERWTERLRTSILTVWHLSHNGTRITLSEVQVSSSICGARCKTVTQSWFTSSHLRHTYAHKEKKDKAVSNFIYISYYFLIYGQFTDYITNRVCAVHLDRDVGHVDPLMSRMKETGDFFLCISIQLLQGRADTYIIMKVTVGCCDSCGQNESCRPCPTELGLSKHELCHMWLIFNFR